ncbi:GLPGLI family protein [Sphingobacterium chungjuense]|uniref:GLPGLI family protein n=1 Tax=Sphingobacterium chungjuense TaxID=2675553 RepID=UPI00140CA2E1|nr:GLPGLI family protein [Sphingobacterium chungjuense]
MKKILQLLVLVALLPMYSATAQYAYFPQEGVITFDKTVHIKNLLKRHVTSLKDGDFQKRFIEELIPKVSETIVLKKKLSFSGQETNWEPIKETMNPIVTNLLNMGLVDYQNTAYQNIKTDEAQSSFDLAGSNIYVKDSLLNVKWKITDEYREIAGYSCRRANGVVLDSVYVVAFYTDQIPLSAGPNVMHGLPGMILGLVVPEQHFNMYATKVDFSSPVIKTNIGGKRATAMTRREMEAKMRETMGNWLSEKQLNLLLAAMQL